MKERVEGIGLSRAWVGLAGLAAGAAVLLPLLLWRLDSRFVRSTYGEGSEPFELFGLTAAATLLAAAALWMQRRPGLTWSVLLPILIPLLLMLHFTNLISETAVRAWDYNCYEAAAGALMQGVSPYGSCYLYPPLLADGMAAVYNLLAALNNWGSLGFTGDELWFLLFYLFQCSQLFLVGLAYLLNLRLARRLGLSEAAAIGLVGALLLFNVPLFRTLRHNQVNLWVLNLVLLAVLAVEKRPLLAGLAVALGAHLKLIPAVLLLPWTLLRRWRALAAAVTLALLIIFIQADFGRDWALWQQFVDASGSFPRGTFYRDNSLHSVAYNLTGLFTRPKALGGVEPFNRLVLAVTGLFTLAILAWFGRRLWRRERFFRRANDPLARRNRVAGHTMDALALTLITAPRVWEHHYLLAIPIIIWAAAIYGRQRPRQIGLAAVLMLGLPTFDLFPFSYHRLAGLLLLLYTARPGDEYEPAQV